MLEINEHLLELAAAVDIMFCPCLLDTKYADVEALDDGAIDVCLFNGAIRTGENAELARLLRKNRKSWWPTGPAPNWVAFPAWATSKGTRRCLSGPI